MTNMRTKYIGAKFLLALAAMSSACAHTQIASENEHCAVRVAGPDPGPDIDAGLRRVQFLPKKSGCNGFLVTSGFSSFIARVPVFSEMGISDVNLREGILLMQEIVEENEHGKSYDLPEEVASFADRASEVSIHEEHGNKLIIKFEIGDGGVLVSRDHGEIDAAYVIY